MQAIKRANTKNMEREEWLKLRKQGIGGSDAAAIAGVHPYRSPLEVYFDKTNPIVSKDEGNEAMYWGNVLEDIVAQEFKKRTGFKVQRNNFILQHPDYPWMIANIDRLIIDPKGGCGILECKTANVYQQDRWQDDSLPDEYLLQVQHYLAVTGLAYAYIAVLIGGQRYMHKRIERDEEMIQALIQIEKDFWESVETRTPPEWTGKGKEYVLVGTLYPPEDMTEDTTCLDHEEEAIAQEYAEIVRIIAENEKKKKELQTKIRAYMQNFAAGFGSNFTVKCVNVSRNQVNIQKLKDDGIYEKYAQTTNSKRLTVKRTKEEASWQA